MSAGPVRLMPDSPDAQRWDLPPLGEPAPRKSLEADSEPMPQPPSLEDIEAIQREAHEEGYAAGHAEGLAAAQAEMRRLQARLEGILDAFSQPLSQLEGELEQALVELAARIAGALTRNAYREQPQLLARLTREAIDSLGERPRSLEVRLHPEDLESVEPLLPQGTGARLIGDPALARGDLRVHAEDVRLDARLSTRIEQILPRLLAESGEASQEGSER
jgi:flagellar assembly protein FliH